jgi:hypothetical protein
VGIKEVWARASFAPPNEAIEMAIPVLNVVSDRRERDCLTGMAASPLSGTNTLRDVSLG